MKAKKKSVKTKALRKFASLRELFRTQKRWCQGALAQYTVKDKEGNEVYKYTNPNSPKAEQFCLMGGIKRVYPRNKHLEAMGRLKEAIQQFDSPNVQHIEDWNDNTDREFEDIQAVVKLAKL